MGLLYGQNINPMRFALLTWICFCCSAFGLTTLAWGQSDASLQLIQQQDPKATWAIQLQLSAEETFDAKALKVFVAKEWTEKHQEGLAIAGRIEVFEEHSWWFTPYFPFTEGMEYVAIYPGIAPFSFSIPRTERLPTWVVGIFPERDTIPENTLKLYLHFSAPMSLGQSYQHLYWLNAQGDTLELPFLQLEPELWNEDRTRLTLWLDPGRVKRDLVPNQLLGAPLVAGQHYRLQVDQNWKDKYGNPLEKKVEKSVVVGPADRVKPSPTFWQIEWPPSASRTPLKVHFGEALDHALLQHSISLWNDAQQPLVGTFTIEKGDETLSFYPAQAWAAGSYTLRIDARLEDLAGNNLNRPFDRDLAAQQGEEPAKDYHYLQFVIPDS